MAPAWLHYANPLGLSFKVLDLAVDDPSRNAQNVLGIPSCSSRDVMRERTLLAERLMH